MKQVNIAIDSGQEFFLISRYGKAEVKILVKKALAEVISDQARKILSDLNKDLGEVVG